MRRLKTISRCVLALFMVAAGIMHFVSPAFYVKIMPDYLPWHEALVYISGVCEVLLGVLLLVSSFSRYAAWGIIALLIAVFPANIHVYLNPDLIDAPPLVHLLRLPLQGVLILWAWWHTMGPKEAATSSSDSVSPAT